jgi:DNA polymerase-4
MREVEYRSHPIRLLGLGVSNHKEELAGNSPRWIELELEFEDD